jgi:DnaK suppressor protein
MAPAHTTSNDRLTHFLPGLRTALSQLREFRLQQLAELDAELDGTRTPVTPADTARREVTVTLAAAARHALADIGEAISLLAAGHYGRCRGCGAEIPIQLLQTIPTTRWCLTCRQRLTHRRPQNRARDEAPKAASLP